MIFDTIIDIVSHMPHMYNDNN